MIRLNKAKNKIIFLFLPASRDGVKSSDEQDTLDWTYYRQDSKEAMETLAAAKQSPFRAVWLYAFIETSTKKTYCTKSASTPGSHF